MFGGLPQKKIEISGSEKCILVDPGDGFAMDNGESKNPLRSDRGSGPPDHPPASATVLRSTRERKIELKSVSLVPKKVKLGVSALFAYQVILLFYLLLACSH